LQANARPVEVQAMCPGEVTSVRGTSGSAGNSRRVDPVRLEQQQAGLQRHGKSFEGIEAPRALFTSAIPGHGAVMTHPIGVSGHNVARARSRPSCAQRIADLREAAPANNTLDPDRRFWRENVGNSVHMLRDNWGDGLGQRR
jgi:hypothetical protein